ncbi:glycosyltransferase family 4 protein [Candidatus Peregrinibacteria bacterium]|nr:glycosyltransferase family 4 protein [Candidatus Peregrinibacteria bacterium]
MIIGIDGSRYAGEKATGVEFYSFEIISGCLAELKKKKDKIVLYSREKLKLPEDLRKMKNLENKVLNAKRFWTLSALTKEMKSHPIDVLFVPSHVLPLSRPKKSVITIHDVAFRHLREVYSFKDYHYLNLTTRYAVKNAGKIIVPSDATREDLIELYGCEPKKIFVVPHGFRIKKISQKEIDKVMKKSPVFKYFGIKKETPYILFVGRLESKKNLVRLVEAFYEIAKEFPKYKLVLAGKRGIGFEKLLKTIDKLKLANRVIMPGYVTEEEKFALYKYCQIFAFPSLYEGFGMPILEAFYHGKPVMTSFYSSLPEVAKDACIYVDPYDEEEIENALRRLIKEPRYRSKLIKLGKLRLKDFSWKKAVKKTLKVIYG